MKKPGLIPYPCIGYCMIDARGYCVACGRPPSLGVPEVCARAKVDARDPLAAEAPTPAARKTGA